MVLTNDPDIVGVWVDPSDGSSDHSAVLVDFGLEQPIPHLVCRQEVYLKNSVDWELVRKDVKSLHWNGIIKSPCPVSLLNKALLRVSKDRVPKRTIVARTGDKHWLNDRCDLAHRAKRRSCRVWSRTRSRQIGRS